MTGACQRRHGKKVRVGIGLRSPAWPCVAARWENHAPTEDPIDDHRRHAPHPIYLAGRWVDLPTCSRSTIRRTPASPPAHLPRDARTVRGGDRGGGRRLRADAAPAGVRARPDPARRSAPASGAPRGARPAHRARVRQAPQGRAGRGRPRDAHVPPRRAEEAERMVGETIPLDLNPGIRGRVGITRRFPIGPVAGISPFNFPLNLAAHKVAPAIAAGCPIVLKPPSRDPLTMLTVAEIIDEDGPAAEGAVSILPMSPRARRPAGRRRALQAAVLHRLAERRLADEGARRQEEGRARARAATPAPSSTRSRTSTGPSSAARDRRVHLRGPGLHQRPAAVRPRVDLATRSWSASSTAPRRSRWATRWTRRPSSARWSTRAQAERTERWVRRGGRRWAARVLIGRPGGRCVLPADGPRRRARATRRCCSEEAFAPIVVALPVRRLRGCDRARSTTAASGSRPGSSRNDLAHAWRRSRSSRSAASSSTTCRPTASTTCPTAASRTRAWAARACAAPIEDMTELRILVVAQPG